MCFADIMTQTVIEGRTWRKSHDASYTFKSESAVGTFDPWRTCRWTVAGLTLHGPYFFVGFRRIDNVFSSRAANTSWLVVVKKTAAAQLVLFPPYLVALFSFMGVMEGKPVDVVASKVFARVPEAFLSGCLYWPLVNVVNFAVVPSTMRVPYVAIAAAVWNSYLSWANARDVGIPSQVKKMRIKKQGTGNESPLQLHQRLLTVWRTLDRFRLPQQWE
jgi:Mpv17 / PMP22 family